MRRVTPEKQLEVQIWVDSEAHGRYCAAKLENVYESDVNKALKTITDALDRKIKDQYTITTKVIGGGDE